MPKPPTTSDGLFGVRFSQYTIQEVENWDRGAIVLREYNRGKYRSLVRKSKKQRLSYSEREEMDLAIGLMESWDGIHKKCMAVLRGVTNEERQ